MKETIDRERRITAAVRQLKNDLKDEKADHEEKVCRVNQNLVKICFLQNLVSTAYPKVYDTRCEKSGKPLPF